MHLNIPLTSQCKYVKKKLFISVQQLDHIDRFLNFFHLFNANLDTFFKNYVYVTELTFCVIFIY